MNNIDFNCEEDVTDYFNYLVNFERMERLYFRSLSKVESKSITGLS